MAKNKSTGYEILTTEVVPFTKGAAMGTALADLSVVEQVRAYKAVDFVEKQIKPRKAALREELLAYVNSHGEAMPKSNNSQAMVEGFRLTKELRRGSTPNAEKLRGLLEKHEIDIDEAFDTVKVLQPSPSKIKYLVDSGKITAEEAESLHDITEALKVTEPKEVKGLLAECKP